MFLCLNVGASLKIFIAILNVHFNIVFLILFQRFLQQNSISSILTAFLFIPYLDRMVCNIFINDICLLNLHYYLSKKCDYLILHLILGTIFYSKLITTKHGVHFTVSWGISNQLYYSSWAIILVTGYSCLCTSPPWLYR